MQYVRAVRARLTVWCVAATVPWSCAALAAQEPVPTEEQRARQQALDEALRALQQPQPVPEPTPQAPATLASPQLRLVDVSLDALFAVGSSTESGESLRQLEGGAHDPRTRGFTVQNVELSLLGAVDPYFTAEAHIAASIDPATGDSEFELEEAFAVSQALPAGLQLKVGQFFTEFGRINPRHPHAWDWLDQPVINTRLMGPDGMRGPGARLSWLTPLPWYAELIAGVQNANGETMASFLANEEFFAERPIGGRPFVAQDVHDLGDLVWLLRLDNGFDLSETWSTSLGTSAVFGPNATGPDGNTLMYGADVVAKWRPKGHFRGWPFVVLQGEVMARHYDAASALVENDPTTTADDVLLPQDTLDDWGLYAQALYGFTPGWAAGLRYEFATGSGGDFDATGAPVPRSDDPFRDDRHRIAPLLVWQATEFSRLRLQYNYDRAQHLTEGDAHSVWLGFEFLIGKHPVHAY